jgi:hypothetical protein
MLLRALPSVTGFNRRKMDDERRPEVEKQAAASRAIK